MHHVPLRRGRQYELECAEDNRKNHAQLPGIAGPSRESPSMHRYAKMPEGQTGRKREKTQEFSPTGTCEGPEACIWDFGRG